MDTLSAGNILGVIGIVTAIFQGGIFIGVIWNKLARHEDQINAHTMRIQDHDEELKFLKGLR
jgi:hypothetical protein